MGIEDRQPGYKVVGPAIVRSDMISLGGQGVEAQSEKDFKEM